VRKNSLLAGKAGNPLGMLIEYEDVVIQMLFYTDRSEIEG
jgi:hypothetical protein